jgi:hypothetical protein
MSCLGLREARNNKVNKGSHGHGLPWPCHPNAKAASPFHQIDPRWVQIRARFLEILPAECAKPAGARQPIPYPCAIALFQRIVARRSRRAAQVHVLQWFKIKNRRAKSVAPLRNGPLLTAHNHSARSYPRPSQTPCAESADCFFALCTIRRNLPVFPESRVNRFVPACSAFHANACGRIHL